MPAAADFFSRDSFERIPGQARALIISRVPGYHDFSLFT
jgi:hypothetical protein